MDLDQEQFFAAGRATLHAGDVVQSAGEAGSGNVDDPQFHPQQGPHRGPQSFASGAMHQAVMPPQETVEHRLERAEALITQLHERVAVMEGEISMLQGQLAETQRSAGTRRGAGSPLVGRQHSAQPGGDSPVPEAHSPPGAAASPGGRAASPR
jgi:hypothetical protein